MTIKTKTVVIILAITFVATFFGGFFLGRFQRDKISETFINTLNGVMRTYVYEIDGLRKQAWEKDAIIASQKQAIEQGIITKEELRKLKIKYANQVTHLEAEVNILLDSLKHSGTIVVTPCPPGELYHPVIYLPFEFGDKTLYYDIWGAFDTVGKLDMKIKVPVDLDIWTGRDSEIKGNYKVVVTSLNPYVSINDIKSFKFDLPKPKKWGIGIVGAYGLGYSSDKQVKLMPFIGIGVSRNFIRF